MLLIKNPDRSSSFYFQWILISALLLGGVEMQIRHLRTQHFTAGLAYKLECNSQTQNVSVTWSYNVSRRSENIRVKGNALWFLPVEPFHRGNYTCLSRKGNESWVTVFNISVGNESCPRMNRENTVQSTNELLCMLEHVFHLDPQAHVTWLKNCRPLDVMSSKFLPMNRSADEGGLYTCFVKFTFEGQNYSAAQTTKIYSLDKVVMKPKVIFPRQDTLRVILGESYDLKCKALIGKNGRDETIMYWVHDLKSLHSQTSDLIIEEDDSEYMLSILHIPEIKPEHVNTNFSCVIEHPAGTDFGTVRLIPADQKYRYLWIALGLISVFILAAVGFHLFKVDLVLVYRDLCSPVALRSDGKSYDAYVSYLYGEQLRLSSLTFALHSLPAVLEERYGYKLFISGRDELPGEAVHDIIAERINQSRRLIVVLTSQSFESQSSASQKHTEPLLIPSVSTDLPAVQMWGTYEQRVGLYDALVKEGLKVILVQVDDGVEESSLPESLQYISRTKGILRWRRDTDDTNRRFWKHLRYQMPPAQRRKTNPFTELQEV